MQYMIYMYIQRLSHILNVMNDRKAKKTEHTCTVCGYPQTIKCLQYFSSGGLRLGISLGKHDQYGGVTRCNALHRRGTNV